MNFDIKRWKILDYVVLGLFVLMIISVSLTWWKTDVSGGISSGIEAAGVTDEDLALAEAAGVDLSGMIAEAAAAASMYEVKAQGWDFDSIVFCWVLSLLVALVVVAKPFFPIGQPLPKWFMQALVTMAFEPRFAMVLVGSSGAGCATLHSLNFGEAFEILTGSGEYH